MLNYQLTAEKIFSVRPDSFDNLALEVFHFQYNYNALYRQYVDQLGIEPGKIDRVNGIPFLPVVFFKTHDIIADRLAPAVVFSSSGTTGTVQSRHPVADLSLYEKSFLSTFRQFYGDPAGQDILCLLPSYLEREGSSLVYMADKLIQLSGRPESGFFLHDHEALALRLRQCEEAGQPTLLLGVTYALLDFAEQYPMSLRHTTIMETGGMKGRREEMVREQVHEQLQKAFGVPTIHSEYGMTELLSQAYSAGNGIYRTPPWMKVLPGDLYDPLEVKQTGRGTLHIIDLTNLLSCSFIATQDLGDVREDGSFTVLGRTDNSDVRGCNLMVASP